MRITNPLHFTENHRFCVYREFSLSSLDYKMIGSIYQPMIGAFAVSLYMLLYQQISAEKIGYSPLEQQRRLFLALDLELSERGRRHLIEQSSKLEAVGLLQTSRKYLTRSDDHIYEYELLAPLSPNEFFKNQHLTMLLRDKVGKFMVLSYREQFLAPEPAELSEQSAVAEVLSVPFYDLFQLNTQVIDFELEQALYELAPSRQAGVPGNSASKSFHYSDIITRFPRESNNRRYVEHLKYEPEQMEAINYVASKYDLTLPEVCRLLDEDGAFSERGELLVENLQHKANSQYRQGKKRAEDRERQLKKTAEKKQDDELPSEQDVEMAYYLEVPAVLQGQCSVHEYNMILRNQPYTLVLKKFFPGTVPDRILDIFEKIDLNYKLKEEVINVLIHYLKACNLSWTKPFIDSIASDMLGKQVGSYEQAVEYIREAVKVKQKSSAGGASGSGRKTKQKPKIPIIADAGKQSPLTEEELEAILRKARKLDGMRER